MTKDANALLDFVSGLSSVSPADGKKISEELSPVAVPVKKPQNAKPAKKEEKAGKEEKQEAPAVKDMMRTSIYIDKPLYRKFKAFSVEVNHSITDLLTAAITDMLETGKLPKSLNN